MEITEQLVAKKAELEKWLISHGETHSSWSEVRSEYLEVCRLINEPVPVKEIPFNNSKVVACNRCSGSGKIITGILTDECTLCGGEGLLHRTSEGIIKLFKIK